MDRNNFDGSAQQNALVALRKESVDRNVENQCTAYILRTSLSARRAWIEIVTPPPVTGAVSVALRKESVDRNFGGSTASCAVGRSLSARRAWIEIAIVNENTCCIGVALRKESVDRN